MSDDTNEVFEPLDFVYCGLRFGQGGKVGVSIRTLKDGKLHGEGLYIQKGKVTWTIGGVYEEAKFSETSAHGFSSKSVRFVRHWDVGADLIDWRARNDHVESALRTKKLEADARRVNEIESVMLPLRRQYETYRRQRDHAGMEALVAAVTRALRTAPAVREVV